MSYLLPLFILFTLALAVVKRVSLVDSFSEGVREAITLIVKLVPNLVAVFVALELMRVSGLSEMIGKVVSPLFLYLGIPKELIELIILRPLSGSGSLAILEDVFLRYGADSYVGISASIIMGSTETIVYVCSVYLAGEKDKKTGPAVAIALLSSFLGCVLACALARLIT